MKKIKNDGFLSLLGILLTLIIIGFLSYTAFKNYSSSVSQTDKSMDKTFKEQGINTTSYQAVLDTTRKRVNDLTQQQINYFQQVEDLPK